MKVDDDFIEWQSILEDDTRIVHVHSLFLNAATLQAKDSNARLIILRSREGRLIKVIAMEK